MLQKTDIKGCVMTFEEDDVKNYWSKLQETYKYCLTLNKLDKKLT
jgi:hypothetical protein